MVFLGLLVVVLYLLWLGTDGTSTDSASGSDSALYPRDTGVVVIDRYPWYMPWRRRHRRRPRPPWSPGPHPRPQRPTVLPTSSLIVPKPKGGDRDEHGCLGSAGYSWNDAKQSCERP